MLDSGGSWVGSSGGGGGGNAFAFVQPDAGTTPAAGSSDTLIQTSSDGSVLITGNSGTKTIDFTKAGMIVEISSWSSPTSLANAATISAPTKNREKRYLVSSGGAVVVTIANGSNTKELYLVGTHDTNTVEIDSSSNVVLSGPWVGKLGSMICLHWTQGLNKYIEAHRNEI